MGEKFILVAFLCLIPISVVVWLIRNPSASGNDGGSGGDGGIMMMSGDSSGGDGCDAGGGCE
jgi:uncharacterized membrane protein YgcG